MSKIIIVGAGLVGGLAALAFRSEGYHVEVYEMRSDPRSEEARSKTNLRSINLAFSARGITSLRSIDPDICDRIMKTAVPLHSRAVHLKNGTVTKQPYGLYGETINSVNRAHMARQLLDELEGKGIPVYFDTELVTADLRGDKSSLTFKQNGEFITVVADIVLGCDGANSAVRGQLLRAKAIDFSQEFIKHCYFELKAPADCGLDPNCFHVWPRTDFMTIAMSNTDGAFVVTLFATRDRLNVPEHVWISFMKKEFPDLAEIIGDDLLSRSFKANKINTLGSVDCGQYNLGGKVLLLGDAAHAIVPFLGQGMNAGFEDVRVLMDILRENKFNFAAAFDEYSETRKADLDAISLLSLRNYTELGHDVATPSYIIRKKVDGILSRRLKDRWLPLYTMITFRPDLRYSEALEKFYFQRKLLHLMIDGLAGSTIWVVAGYYLFKWWRS